MAKQPKKDTADEATVRKAEEPEQQTLAVAVPIERYSIVLADPPWRYLHSRSANRAIERHYPTLTTAEIAALPVEEIVTTDALLYMWATAPKLEDGLRVLRAWGFAYVTHAVWDKVTLGMGYHFRGQHELLLLGKRGTFSAPPPSKRVASVIRAPRGEHSRKPEVVYEIIEDAYPNASKIEIFARARRTGWAAWGNEVQCDLEWPNPADCERSQLGLDF